MQPWQRGGDLHSPVAATAVVTAEVAAGIARHLVCGTQRGIGEDFTSKTAKLDAEPSQGGKVSGVSPSGVNQVPVKDFCW